MWTTQPVRDALIQTVIPKTWQIPHIWLGSIEFCLSVLIRHFPRVNWSHCTCSQFQASLPDLSWEKKVYFHTKVNPHSPCTALITVHHPGPLNVFRAGGPLRGESHLNLHWQNRPYFYCGGHVYSLEHFVKTKTECAESALEAGVVLVYSLLVASVH